MLQAVMPFCLGISFSLCRRYQFLIRFSIYWSEFRTANLELRAAMACCLVIRFNFSRGPLFPRECVLGYELGAASSC